MQVTQAQNMERLQRFAEKHIALFLIVHIWITALLIFSGPNHLEPLAATWFWAPLLAVITTPDRWFGYELIGRRTGDWPALQVLHTRLRVFAVWVLSFTLVPFLLWKYLMQIDGALHALRQHIGAALGLGGQTGLVLTVASLLTVLFTVVRNQSFPKDQHDPPATGVLALGRQPLRPSCTKHVCGGHN